MPALALAVSNPYQSPEALLPAVAKNEWASGKPFVAPCDDFRTLAWIAAVSGCFLGIGIFGVIQQDLGAFTIKLSAASAPAGIEQLSELTSMAELQATAHPGDTQFEETVAEEPFSVSEFLEVPSDLQDLPELVPPLLTEDLFTVPTAPAIETALKAIEPEKPRTEVTQRPVSPKVVPSSQTITTRTSRAGTSSNNASAGGGGTGGSGISGVGGGGRFPTPPYPSFARSRGIQGTVMLTIVVNSAGLVEKTLVSNSTGFSELDSYAASWVRRNWRFPAGNARTLRLPVVFKLR